MPASPNALSVAKYERPWHLTERELPPDGVVVEVLNGDEVHTLKRSGRLWFFPDGSMYVYYVPRAWRFPAKEASK